MSRGVNKVTLIGRLGSDPEVRYTAGGGTVANVTLATSEQWKDKHTGESKERTEWHKVVFFNRLAEIVGEYLKKGAQVYIEGRLQTEKWQDKQGIDRYTTKIIAHEMQMLGSRGDSQQQTKPAGNNNTVTPPVPPAPAMGSFDDDIPF